MRKIETKFIFIIGILLVHATLLSYGQRNCQKDKIYGVWKTIGSAGGYKNIIDNVDSLKKVISIHSEPGIFEFQMNGAYTFMHPTLNPDKPYFRRDVYTFDGETCQLILGTKKKAYKKSNLKILYVDDNYMIITNDNNPHGDYTTLYSRQ